MNSLLDRYKNEINGVFGIGVTVLNGARSLKSISLDLKLLAINGIVQAAKIGSNQGQSLITLSGFLSDLPLRIAPELEELEELAGHLSRELTLCSISVRRFIQYSLSAEMSINQIYASNNSVHSANDFDLMSIKVLSSFHTNGIFAISTDLQKSALTKIAAKNIAIIEVINKQLIHGHSTIIQAKHRIDNIKRNGFIANYMGSNILIETSYLASDKRSFQSLVGNIRGIVDKLNSNLDDLLEIINKGDTMLSQLVNLRKS